MARATELTTLAALFCQEPPQWGLRGDPFLWAEMAQRFESVAFPTSPAAARTLIEEAFSELTGRPLSHPDPFYVERYNQGGMSSGCVCPKFWRDTAVPLLLARAATLDDLKK